MPCIYCLSDHAGDCPQDPIAARSKALEAAGLANKHAETAVWAAERAREAARVAAEAAAMCEQAERGIRISSAQLAYRRAEEATAAAQLADRARANCVTQAEAAQLAAVEVQHVVQVIRKTHARLELLITAPVPQEIVL